jgi:hypothetical protein
VENSTGLTTYTVPAGAIRHRASRRLNRSRGQKGIKRSKAEVVTDMEEGKGRRGKGREGRRGHTNSGRHGADVSLGGVVK